MRASYIAGTNLLTDLFSVLFEMPKATSMEESQKRINEALNVLRIIKKRDLWEKLTQEHIDRTITISLMKKDEEDFDREWSKVQADELIQLGNPLDMDWGEENEQVISMDKSIASETNRGCLERKKKFLITFRTRKLIELGNRRITARNLSMDKPQKSLSK